MKTSIRKRGGTVLEGISSFGLGYVGSVTAGCLSSEETPVVGVDVNPEKVDAVNSGHSPVLEPGLDDLLLQGRRNGHLRATCDAHDAIAHTNLSFVCVGTPSLAQGKLDLSVVESVCRQIGAALASKRDPHTVVVRSTVLPGSTDSLVIPTLEQSSGKRCGVDFHVCTNPEFLREGTAVADFREPYERAILDRHPGQR